MKSKRGHLLALSLPVLTILLLLSGCATYEECGVAYLTPSTKAIPGDKPKVNVLLRTTYGLDAASSTVLANLKQAISSQKGLILTNKGDAEYIICLDLFYVYREDTSQSAKFNTNITVTPTDSSKSSGTQRIKRTAGKTSIGSLIANVSLYRTAGLEPVTYFSLVNYVSNRSTLSAKLPSTNLIANKLASEIIGKIKEMMVTDYRTIKTFIPNNADSTLLKEFKSSMLMKIPPRNLPSTKILLSKMRENMRVYSKMYKENPKSKEKVLSDYYIKFLMNERSDLTADNLKLLHKAYMYILDLTDNEGLILGSANSLGRIENKTACLGVAIND